MTHRYEYLTLRLTYNPAPFSNEKELEGFLDNLKIPVLALLHNYRNRNVREIVLKLVIDDDGNIGAVAEVTLPIDSDNLAEHVRNTVSRVIEDTFTMFPDRIDIIYREVELPEVNTDDRSKGGCSEQD